MGYAPVALITGLPDPLTTGTVISVYDGLGHGSPGSIGDRFPLPPFEAIMWPSQTIPIFSGDLQNAEKPTVIAVDGDTLTLVRGNPPVAVFKGMQIAALVTVPKYNLGDEVLISATFPTPNPPYSVTLTDPDGYVTSYGPLEGVEDAGLGVANFQFEPTKEGTWNFRFSDADGKPAPERQFFVGFSEATSAPIPPIATPVEVQYVSEGWQGNWADQDYATLDLVIYGGKVYQASIAIAAGSDVPGVNTDWVLKFDPTDAPPTLLSDTGDIIVRAVTTDPRDSAPVDPAHPVYLAVVDIGSWGQPDVANAAFEFGWEQGTASDPLDLSWGATADFFDGTYCRATHAAYYRARVTLTNAHGSAEVVSFPFQVS